MNVAIVHPEWMERREEWARARDVLAGEDAVKRGGEKYLPRLESQSDEEYAAYRMRASLFGASARTLAEYLDLVFRRAPALTVKGELGMQAFVEDCDLWGTSFISYARRVVAEVLAMGRAGSLVLWDENNRPVVSFWTAEQIMNWSVERSGTRVVLSSVVLRSGERIAAFRLIDGSCYQEDWSLRLGRWFLIRREELKWNGESVRAVPFVFHGPKHSRPDTDRAPLADIISANLDHYRLDADLKHGLHFAALPTAWVTGFDKAAPLRIGASTAWVSDIPGASAGFLEFSGAGLAQLDKAMEKAERRMALLGARMLERAGEGESGATGAGLCGLGSVVASLNQSLSKVLQLAHGSANCEGIGISMNTDLAQAGMNGELITAVVNAWRSGAISRESMLEMLKRGEVLPEGRTVAQERALLHRKAGANIG